ADLIASSSQAAHALASQQMRGGYSASLETLRERLVALASLLELELDFSEEDVEFADRQALRETLEQIGRSIDGLRRSFALGNAIKEGVAVAIAGAPNVGKSTLLNRLLNDERALVSDIAGTPRDVIEEQTNIDGVVFRFLDTAGIRTTDDRLEQMGIQRTIQSIRRARIVIYLAAADSLGPDGSIPQPDFILSREQTLLTVVNKIDTCPTLVLPEGTIGISARSGAGIDDLCLALRECVDTRALFQGDPVVSHSRHFQALSQASGALQQALSAFDSLPADLLAEEIRTVTAALGSITGRGLITPDEILSSIFSKFCIGK
ncbi:MAG: GTP-binding protein, partial [Alistipes sp.]|nr:GTP-binding protein [Alistipes sp.]